ncbi:MAG: hypothetical protein IJS94_02400, partial [Clostridia bacterium]|nr:hypothetical protein [Clostridia bacterium]
MMTKEKKRSPISVPDTQKRGEQRSVSPLSGDWRKKGKRITVLLLTFAVLFSCLVTSVSADSIYGDSMYRASLDDIKNLLTSDTYTAYLQSHKDVADAADEIKLDIAHPVTEGENATTATYKLVTKEDNLFTDENGAPLEALVTGDDGLMTVDIPGVVTPGMYSIEVTYYTGDVFMYSCHKCDPGLDGKCSFSGTGVCTVCGAHTEIKLAHNDKELAELKNVPADYKCPNPDCPMHGGEAADPANYAKDHTSIMYSKSSKVERSVFIDGLVPYREARSVELTKAWVDNYYNKEEKVKNIRSDSEKFFETVNNTDDRLFRKDTNGNESRPEKSIVQMWKTEF